MLVVGRSPGNAIQIDAVFALKNAPHPQPSRDGVAAIDAHSTSLQIFGTLYTGVDVVEDGPVREASGEEHGNRRERLAVGFSTKIRGEGHLADVECEAAHHSSHGRDDRVNL